MHLWWVKAIMTPTPHINTRRIQVIFSVWRRGVRDIARVNFLRYCTSDKSKTLRLVWGQRCQINRRLSTYSYWISFESMTIDDQPPFVPFRLYCSYPVSRFSFQNRVRKLSSSRLSVNARLLLFVFNRPPTTTTTNAFPGTAALGWGIRRARRLMKYSRRPRTRAIKLADE